MPLQETTNRAPIHTDDRLPEIKNHRLDLLEVRDPVDISGYTVSPIVIKSVLGDYELPPVFVALPKAAKGSALDGPDSRYREIAQGIHDGVLDVARRPLKHEKSGRVLGTHTRYYTWQCFRHYDYAVHHETATNIPTFVHQQRTALEQTLRDITGGQYLPTDQMMYNYYLSDQGINLHGDEDTQGYILSESLGADGLFDFGMSPKAYFTRDFLGLLGTPQEPRKGTWVRERLDDFVKDGNKSDDEVLAFLKALEPGNRLMSPRLAQITLPHGAIVCMPGGQFQDETEHAVTISGKGKFWPRINITLRALTSKDTK
jgi:hypothetical protein